MAFLLRTGVIPDMLEGDGWKRLFGWSEGFEVD